MSELLKLAEECEKAAGFSGQLDARIAVALRIPPDYSPTWLRDNFPTWGARSDGRVEVVHADGRGGVHWAPKRYTASIDAALTLVPDGMEYSISTLYGLADAEVGLNCSAEDGPWRSRRLDADVPLALCAAALKARARAEGEE